MSTFAPAFDYVHDLVQTAKLPSAVFGVADASGRMETQAFGDWPSGKAVQDNDAYYTWSLTKPVVALAFMQLVECGLLNLQHEVKHYLPDFGVGRPDTVQLWHLLTHTNGTSELSANDFGISGLSLQEQLPRAGLNFLAGSHKQYSNLGFVAQQAILERVTGQSLEAYLQQNLFEPLCMTHSSMTTHEHNADGFLPMFGTEKAGLDFEAFLTLKSPAAGLFSTAPDLLKLGQCLLNGGAHASGRLLSNTTLREMTSPQTIGIPALVPDDWINDYEVGLGFLLPTRRRSILYKNIYGHHGWGGCKFWMYPHEDVCFALMTNLLDPESYGVDLDAVHNVFSACL